MAVTAKQHGFTFTYPDGTSNEFIDADIAAFIENQTQAETTAGGVVMSLVSGLNQGALDIADLPSGIINMLYRESKRQFGAPVEMDEKVIATVSDVLNKIPTGQGGLADVVSQSPADTDVERAVNKGAQIAGGGVTFAGGAKNAALQADKMARLVKGTQISNPSVLTNIAKNNGFLKSEVVASVGAGSGGGLANYMNPDSMVAEIMGTLGGGLVGATPQVVKQTARGVKSQLVEPWTEAGVKKRISAVLREHSSDPQAAIDRINENKKLFTEVLGDDIHIPSTVLANDPGLSDTFYKLAAEDPKILSILRDFSGESDKLLLKAIARQKKGNATGAESVKAVNDLYARLNKNMTSRLEALTAKSDEMLESMSSGRVPEETSIQFRDGIERMYNAFKETENTLWRSIPDSEVNYGPLKKDFKSFKSSMTKQRWSKMDGETKNLILGLGGKKGTGSIKELLDTRSILLENSRRARADGNGNLASMLREVDEMIGKFIDDPSRPTSEAYRRAAAMTRRKHEAFTQGSIGNIRGFSRTGEEARSADTTLRGLVSSHEAGAKSGKDIHRVAAGDVLEEIPGDKGILSTTEDYVVDKFIGAASPAQRATFLKNYAPLLRQFPDLHKTLLDVSDDISKLADDAARVKGRQATLNDKSKFYAAKLLNTDPLKLPDTLLNMVDGDLNKLMTLMKGKPQALEGIRNSVLERLSAQLMNSRGQTGSKFLSAMYKKDPRLGRMVKTVLTKEQQAGLTKLDDALKALEPPAVAGTKPNTTDALKNSGLVRLASRVFGARAGARAAEGGSSILAANAAANFSESIANFYTKSKSQDLLNLALRDPKVMRELLRPVNTKEGLIQANDRLRGYLITLGYSEDDQ